MQVRLKLHEMQQRCEKSHVTFELSDSVCVNDLRAQLSLYLREEYDSLTLIYCGRTLKDDKQLSSYRIKNGSLINVIMKKTQREMQKETANPSKQEVMKAFEKLMNQANRHTWLIDSGWATNLINEIIAESEELQTDSVAQAILKDSAIIDVMSDPQNVDGILTKHPSLGAAVIMISKALEEKVRESGASTPQRASAGSYSLDRMSDDEAEPSPATPASQRATTTNHITTSQLAMALAAASSPGTSQQHPQPVPARPQPTVSRNALSQALMGILGNATPPAAVNPAPELDRAPDTSQTYQAQLQQLRDMGITDDDVALRALQAAGGNVHIALDMIYGNTM